MGLEIKFTNEPFNIKQKLVLGLSIAAILMCLLFPPWLQVWGRGQLSRPLGYSFIFSPPDTHDASSIDFTRLIIQLIIVGIVGFVLYYLASKESKKTN